MRLSAERTAVSFVGVVSDILRLEKGEVPEIKSKIENVHYSGSASRSKKGRMEMRDSSKVTRTCESRTRVSPSFKATSFLSTLSRLPCPLNRRASALPLFHELSRVVTPAMVQDTSKISGWIVRCLVKISVSCRSGSSLEDRRQVKLQGELSLRCVIGEATSTKPWGAWKGVHHPHGRWR